MSASPPGGNEAHLVFLGIGSNVDPEKHVVAGVLALREAFGPVDLSPVYRSRAVGFEGRDFLNLAAAIRTRLSPRELKSWLAALEDRHGRRRDKPRFSDRNLDIDILLHDDRILDDDGLVLPRPEILHYAHVLKPLADLAPDRLHPETGRSMAAHWRDFRGDDQLSVHPLEF